MSNQSAINNQQATITNQQSYGSSAAPAAPAALARIGAVQRSAGAGRAKEQFAAVGEGDVPAVGAGQGVIARLITVHDDLGAARERLLGDSAAKQRVRRAAFDHPLLALR